MTEALDVEMNFEAQESHSECILGQNSSIFPPQFMEVEEVMFEPLEQPRVPVARSSPPKKKARRKKIAAARGDDGGMLEKATQQAEEELVEQNKRMQRLWEENPGTCLEGHRFLVPFDWN